MEIDEITEPDYEHAENVFSTFEMKNIGNYCDLYAQSDTSLLLDIFENLRQVLIHTIVTVQISFLQHV